MSKTKSYYLSNPSEETQRLLAEMQKEMDGHNTLSPEQEMEEMAKDPAYQEFIESVNEAPF